MRVFTITLSDVTECPTHSLLQAHYRIDGSCEHNDPKPHEQNFEDDTVPHMPDWKTVALADVPMEQGRVIFDVWCSVCGQSGSFRLDILMSADNVAWV